MNKSEIIDSKLLRILACPICKSYIFEKDGKLTCSNKFCNEEFEIIEGIPVMLPRQKLEYDMKITKLKWEKVYEKYGDEYYDPNNVPKVIQISSSYIEAYMSSSAKYFLEAGCGTARSSLATTLKHDNLIVICLDISLVALCIAKRLFKEINASGFFVCGDLRFLPFKDRSIDFIFSDGAIEHFKETCKSMDEFFRVLKREGGVLVTVPHVSISMLTYGSLHGNIPNILVLKQILEFIHTRLLNGKLMKNGYELSFTVASLKNLMSKFSHVEVGSYQTFHELNWIRNELLRKIIRKLCKNRLFCPLIDAFGVKTL